MTAETSNARGEWPERYACNGPEGTFWTDDAALANKLIAAAFDRDEWTVTDTQNPTGATPPPPAAAEPKTLPVPTHVYLTDKAAVIVGTPERGWDDDAQDAHNCDAMGCATIGPHVLARVPFTDERALSQRPAPSAPVGVEGPLSLLRAGHWREVYIGHRCMQLELTYDYATWERLMAEVESALAQQPAAVGEEIMVNAAHDVFTLPLQPSGLSSGPRFVVHVPAPEQQPAAVDGPYRTVDGVVTVNGIALDEAVKLGDRYAATIEKRGMPRAAQVLEALVMIGRHALAAQHQEPKS